MSIEGDGEGRILLVADDDPAVARSVRRMIRGALEVVAVETVAGAIAIARSVQPLCAALVDASFAAGELDGLAIVDVLLQRDARGLVAVYTGLDPSLVEPRMRARGVPVFVKPAVEAIAGFVERARRGPSFAPPPPLRSLDDDLARLQRECEGTLLVPEIELCRDLLATGSLDDVRKARDAHPDTVRRQLASLLKKVRAPDPTKLVHRVLAPPGYGGLRRGS